MTNGVEPYVGLSNESQSTTEPMSDFPASGETGENVLPSSSLSAPSDSIDQSMLKSDIPLADQTPPVVQQPTSDPREEVQQTILEHTALPKEQEHQQETVSDSQTVSAFAPASLTPVPAPAELDPFAGTITLIAPPETTTASDPTPAPAFSEDLSKTPEASEAPTEIATAHVPHHPPVPLPKGATSEAPVDLAPSPVLPTESSAPASKPEDTMVDQVMEDAPQSGSKMARAREDDEFGDGPAAKRAKTEEASPSTSDFKVPERPALNTQVRGEHNEEPRNVAPPMTKLQHKHLLRMLSNVKRIAPAKSYLTPVDYVGMNLLNYPTVITKPMDLRSLEENLRAESYQTVDDFVGDFNLIVQNAQTFNGLEHDVTKQGFAMKASFEKQLKELPGPDDVGPINDKKKKAPILAAPKAPPPRRESRSSLPAGSPTAGSPQTFALGPDGVPLIRRDSTLGDGRPKREIHRPAPRDLPYANQKPKKKKYQVELKYCEKVLAELSKPKYANIGFPFVAPVDPVALNIPNYHSVIKKPMDLRTVKGKLDGGEYENAKDFEADVRLIFQNCYKFNAAPHPINVMGHQFEEAFDEHWAKKREWVEANTPASGPQSPGSSPEEDDSDDEEEEEEEEQTQLSKLQQQIAAMSRQVELITQKKKSPPATSKKAKSSKPVKKDHKKAAAPPIRAEKKAPSRPAKKEKAPYVTYEQKQDISNRINSLTESKMAAALKLIRDNMPNLKVRSYCHRVLFVIHLNALHDKGLLTDLPQGVQDDELELDIDELSNDVLYKLLVFVRKHAPRPIDDAPVRPAPTGSTAAPTRKKNKPMSKYEQEARIAQVKGNLSAFQNPDAEMCKSCRSILDSSYYLTWDQDGRSDSPNADEAVAGESDDVPESEESEEE